jgi:hypothetical protein
MKIYNINRYLRPAKVVAFNSFVGNLQVAMKLKSGALPHNLKDVLQFRPHLIDRVLRECLKLML